MGGKTQTVSSSSTPNAAALQQYNTLLGNTAQIAQTPYNPYTGELVAPINSQQQTGISGINQFANAAQPGINQAEGLLTQSAQPLTAAQIQQYYNPYQQSVIGSTEQQFNNQNAVQQSQLLSSQAAQGALGGSGTNRAQSLLAGQQQIAQAPVIAGLEQQGYTQALSTAQQQDQANLQAAAYGIGNTAVAGQNAGLTGANAQFGVGTAQQNTQQALDAALMQQFYTQQAFPFQENQYAAGIDTSVGSQMGGESQTTYPGPSLASELTGLGTFGVGLGSLFATPGAGGSSAASGIAGMFTASDVRLKEDIKHIGKLNDGQKIYRFRYKNDPSGSFYIGLLAQEVEKKHPEAVGESGSYKMVHVKKATDEAARAWGGRVQGLAIGGTPYSNASGYIPQISGLTRGSGPPKPPSMQQPQQQSAQQMMQNAASLAKSFNSSGNSGNANVGLNSQGQFTSGSGINTGYMVNGPNGQPGGIMGVGPLASNPTFSSTPQNTQGGPNLSAGSSDYAVYRSGGRVRAGLGLSSFVSRRARGGLADGGTPDDDQLPPEITTGSSMPSYASAISGNESGGNYGALGPATQGGDRAYGKYQVMGANIPQWTQEVFGQPMTPQQFLSDPSAQDQVFQHKFGQYVDKYGPDGAARAWFAGEGGMNNPDARDSLGTSVSGYADKFDRALGFAPDTSSGAPTAGLATPQEASPDLLANANKISGAQRGSSSDIGMALMSAGLGMMAGKSPFALANIGEGGLQGLSTYGSLQKEHFTEAKEQADVDLKVKQLAQQAKAEQDRIAHEARQYTDLTAAQKAELQFKQRNEQRQEMQPVKIGTDMSTGTDIYGVRDPASGGFRRIDPANGTLGPVISPAPSGNGAQPTPAPGPTVPGAAPDANAPQPVRVASAAETDEAPPTARPDVLANLPPQMAAQVKALDEGRMAFPTGFALKSPYWQNMLRIVAEYDPSFDAVNYTARAKTRADFTAGKSAQNITSFNTAIGHLDTLDKSIDELGNYQVPLLNSATAPIARQFNPQYQAALNNFRTAKQAVTDELTRAFRGSAGNVHDIEEWEKSLGETDSPVALHAAVKSAVKLLNSRVDAVGDQYNRGMGTTRDPLKLLSPHAAAAVQRLGGEAPQQEFSGRTATNPQTGQKLRETKDGQWVQ